ncbi:aminopeptidase [Paenibacillus sambharensis]|nr:aminopeptidase [Paenibacillus sambharensis]
MNYGDVKRLAQTIVMRSLAVTAGQKVLVDLSGEVQPLGSAIVNELCRRGAVVQLRETSAAYLKALISGSSEEQLSAWAEAELSRMDGVDAYIGLRADQNQYEFSDIQEARYAAYMKRFLVPWHHRMAMLPSWLLLKYPTHGMAQLARMGREQLDAIFVRSCLLDYDRLAERARPLGERLMSTREVRIVSPGTDLTFDITGMSHYMCDGRYNLPDGEIFTAPLVESAEGIITFNVPTSFLGMTFEQVGLEFRKGKAAPLPGSSSRLAELLAADEGASRIGEFGIGLNNCIPRPMNQLLFDEKMAGSIHIALGQAFPMADNGNVSDIHWDLVLHQAEEYGGGELYFDGRLVRRNGLFIDDELKPLNTYAEE